MEPSPSIPLNKIGDALAKIDLVVADAGLDRSAIVEMTSYHVGLQDHLDVFKKMRDQYVVEPYPAWTAIEFSGFVTPGAIVEIRVVASTER